MSHTRIVVGRIVALGVLLAMSVLLLAAAKASAGKYQVAQCGWYVGADASWADTTGGAKFRSDGYCVPPAGADPFDGVHLKSFTRDGQATVSGTRFARWRWEAPSGTQGLTAVRGTWWHALHDGMEQRLGGVNWSGEFNYSLRATATDTALRDFAIGFNSAIPAFEDRLLCARGEDKWCSLDSASWSGLRAVTLTVEDDGAPVSQITGGPLVGGGWRRGNQWVVLGDADGGAGVRYGETFVDGNRVGFNEYECNKVQVAGEWRATTMRPCRTAESTTHFVDTPSFSDGPHSVTHCTVDFAGNRACIGAQQFLIDNNPPAHPKAVTLAGGEGWRRTNDFDLAWENPDQGRGSPIAGALWRITAANGYDTGGQFASMRERRSLDNLSVPGSGTFTLRLWLRDEAGNEADSTAVTVPLRLDDVKPQVAFSTEEPGSQVMADVADEHSGPAGGEILYRRVDTPDWTELPTKLVPGNAPGKAHLVAPTPELGYGTYVFRVDAVDGAGNTASTSLRADGTQMAIRREPPPPLAKAVPVQPAKPQPKGKARLFARLRGGHGHGDSLTVPFGAPAMLSGRLTRADGAALAGRELRVVSHPSHGALAPIAVQTVTTGDQGGFEARLPAGPSRRVTVIFSGDTGFDPARRPALELRVRSGISLRAVPARLQTGQAVRLSGKVKSAGAPIPRRGKLVAIQYLEQATHRWRPVLVTRTDHHGRFRAHYRFRYVSGSAAIRLRATALAEEHWPYAPGFSPPVTVKVRG
ncbi:MAG TPA: carboxypeptidase-like regulatory domain-containing protein [Solirubrobacterales bacterium]|nr:carboxypeptidase-like regulatory domain-containing protein [Solirubrobacterales bacterium]